MNATIDLERRLAIWLEQDGPAAVPAVAVEAALAQARTVRQRRAWLTRTWWDRQPLVAAHAGVEAGVIEPAEQSPTLPVAGPPLRQAWVIVLLAALLAALVGGMLIVGSQLQRKLPAVVPPVGPATTYTAVSAPGDHTCALKANGTLECWGSNSYGQATPPDGTFVAVSASERGHTCAIRTDGTLACWGNDSHGQATPPDAGPYMAVSAGFQHTCAIRTDGTLECWGDNGDGQSTPPSGTYSAVSAGSWHTCAIRTDGTLTCWGADDGRLDTPAGAYGSVDAGSQCAIRTDGKLACWGYDVESPAPPGTYVAVSGSMSGGCAIRTDGMVTCWGGEPMALGGATPAPSGSPVETVFPPEPGPPPPTGTFTALSYGASGWEACAIRTDGTLACWGDWIANTESGVLMGPPTNLMPEMRGVLPASEIQDIDRGTVEFGSGGSGCNVTAPSTTFSVGDAIRFAANLEREVRADEVVTIALSVDGVLLERALLGEAASRSFDVPGDCVGGLLHWAYVAPPGIDLSAFPIAWTTGHYRLELSAGGEVLAEGEFDVGP